MNGIGTAFLAISLVATMSLAQDPGLEDLIGSDGAGAVDLEDLDLSSELLEEAAETAREREAEALKARESAEAERRAKEEAARNLVLTEQQKAERDALLKKIDAPLLFVKRHSYSGIHIYDAFYKWPPGGGGIYIVKNTGAPIEEWKARAVVDESSANSLGAGLYTHPDVSWDGKRILFCYKDSPKGNTCIYEIGVDGTGLRKVSDPAEAKVGYSGGVRGSGMHDLSPCYLPDGRIVFLSTRTEGLVPCNDSGVTLLHVMNADGSGIHPISVNSENEFDPSVLPDGQIVYGRWEYIDKNALTVQSLWTVWPDGSNETALFANNMTFPEALLDVRPVPDSPLVAVTQAKHNSHPRGAIAYIDPMLGKNDAKAIHNFDSPGKPTYDRGDSCDPLPLDRDTAVCSGRPAGYRRNVIEIRHRSGARFILMADRDICLHDPLLVKPRKAPSVLPSLADRSRKTGVFYVQNVYDGLDGIKEGEARWLRIVEETSRVSRRPAGRNPYNQTFLISAALAFAAKIYHGIVPISEDGSAYFEAPSGRLLYFQVLDRDKRLIRSMRTFIQATPGTTRSCIGCHEQKQTAPSSALNQHARVLQAPDKPSPESWGTGYMDYPTMVQPVWDRHCIRCHGGEKGFAARLDLTGGWTVHFNNSYENLVDRRETQLVAYYISGIDCMNSTADYSNQIFPPRTHGSATAPLAQVIMSGHKNRFPKMTQAEKDLIMAWIDSNGLYHGTFNYTQHGHTSDAIGKTYARLTAKMGQAGCFTCHEKRFTRDWINLQRPELSRVLRAPLAKGTNGYGQAICRNHKMDPKRYRVSLLPRGRYTHEVRPLDHYPKVRVPPLQPEGIPQATFADTSDPHYQAMLAIIREGREQALAAPRVDMPGAEVVAGKDRMLVLPPVPAVAPSLSVRHADAGAVSVTWRRTADNIGLPAELHRGASADFVPSAETLIQETLLDHAVDRQPSETQPYYALVLKGGVERSTPSRIMVSEVVPVTQRKERK